MQDSTSPRVPSRWRSAWLKETPARPLPRDQASSPQETSPTNPPTLTSTQQVRTWMTCTVGMNFSTCSHSSNISAAALKNPEKKLAFLYFRFPPLKVSRVLSSENLHGYVFIACFNSFYHCHNMNLPPVPLRCWHWRGRGDDNGPCWQEEHCDLQH